MQCCPPEFQDKSRLQYYSSLFNSLEINSSFYKVPMPKTVQKWALSVPDDFLFTFKLWKEVSHNKSLAFKADDVCRFMETIEHAGDKKGCLLIQFPPSTTIEPQQLENLLLNINHSMPVNTWNIAVEFRNKSWYEPEIYDLLEENNAAFVLHDMPASAAPITDQESKFMYLRFHGPNGGYRGSYSEDFLSEYAQYIIEWMEEGKDVYAYFNNTMGDAINNLIRLKQLVNESGR